MRYIILLGCNSPEDASIYSMVTTYENTVFYTLDEAQDVANRINKVEGEGYSRVVAV